MLDSLRAEPPAPPEARARVRGRLAALIPAIGAFGGGGLAGGGLAGGGDIQMGHVGLPKAASPDDMLPGRGVPTGAHAPIENVAKGSTDLLHTGAKAAAWLASPAFPLATFVLGGITGAALLAAISRPPLHQTAARLDSSTATEVASLAWARASMNILTSLAAAQADTAARPSPGQGSGEPASASADANQHMGSEPSAMSDSADGVTTAGTLRGLGAGFGKDRSKAATDKTPTTGRVSQLSVERKMLDEARARLVQGAPLRALEQLDHHRERFPKAMLAEEREAMLVQALVDARRYERARATAAAFRARSPHSLFMSTVDSAIASIP